MSKPEPVLKETLAVGGMTCAACAAGIEKALRKTAGVQDAVVNFAAEKVTVSYDPVLTGPEKFREIIVDLGYSVREAETADAPADDMRERREREELAARKRVVIFAISVTILTELAMLLEYTHKFTSPGSQLGNVSCGHADSFLGGAAHPPRRLALCQARQRQHGCSYLAGNIGCLCLGAGSLCSSLYRFFHGYRI